MQSNAGGFMSYRHIKGTTIEVPDWVQVPAFAEFSEAKLEKSQRAIAYIRRKYFGNDSSQSKTRVAEKTKPQPL
jgi:hypothetical protein